MELLLLVVVLLLILFLSLKILLPSKPKKCSNLPPGNTGWPFLGETLEFLSTGRKGTPEKFFTERTKRYSSEIFRTSLIGEKMAVLCGPGGNKFLFSNENKLVTSWFPRNVKKVFPSSMEASTEEEITKVRKFLPAGNLKLAEYVGVHEITRAIAGSCPGGGSVYGIAKQHLDAYWDTGDEITVLPLAKHFMFAAACRLFLSIDDPDRIAAFEEPFRVLLVGVFSLPVDLPGTNFNRSIRASELIRKEVLKIIKQRKKEKEKEKEKVGHGDILDHMLATTDETGRFMSEADIADKIIGLIVGGQDTTSTVLTFILKYLAELPQIYENVLKEQREIAEGKGEGEMLNWEDLQKMKYSWSVACEAMRLAPPIPGSFREAIADFTYHGFSVPKGWKLYWSVNTTHKNPECFEEPEKFDPSRFEGKGPIPYSFVPFGGGPRMCPGQEYARLVILVLMHNVVTKFRWEIVLPNENIIVEFMPKPANGLPLRMRRHSSSPN